MTDLSFDRDFDPAHGEAVEIVPGIRRLTAPNPGPLTFRGTNSYLVGTGSLVVVDPGPEDGGHLAALLAACGGRPVGHILVTHTHRDHSPGAEALRRATGAELLAAGPHRFARPPRPGETGIEAAADLAFRPDRTLADGERLVTDAATFRVIATPGHTGNHLSFAIEGSDHLLSGDHVMGWSTTVVAPPDGAMAEYMASLARIAAAPERRYLPGHGGTITDGPAFAAGLAAHRRARRAAILDAVTAGAETAAAVVERVYAGLSPQLVPAARLSALAHLEELVADGALRCAGDVSLAGRFSVAA